MTARVRSGARGAKRARASTALVAGLLALPAAAWSGSAGSGQDDAGERTFEITYVAEVDLSEASGNFTMWLPYPKRDAYQDVRLLSIEAPVPTKVYQEPLHRNSMLYLSTSAADVDRLRISMSFRVTRRPHAERDFAELEDPFGYVESTALSWLEPPRRRPIDDETRAQAERIAGEANAFVGKARAIFDYAVRELAADGAPGGVHEAFQQWLRAVGIPVRSHEGFAIPAPGGDPEPDDARGTEIYGHTSWSEFYVPGFGWVPVDPLGARRGDESPDAFFGAVDQNRVELSLGRDVVLNPQQKGGRLDRFVYPYAELDGKPVGDIRSQFFFRDPVPVE